MAPAAWTCVDEPERHGSFLQQGLDNLSEFFGAVQRRDRYGCPICLAKGDPGWLRPSSSTEADRLFAQKEV